ncbi:MAG: helix-turn-helix domain-containing protein [Pseudomonadales bacterium]|jgi:DNA-binding HxlR family transcriptional regulator|nr:helix-turn-helix domain-containing protein [Pseudomonadales bacterium]
MKLKSYSDMDCSLAQTLEIVGERWTLLILRDAFFGIRRFEQFQKRLGIARNILSARLATLVAAGILERRSLTEGGRRAEYHLTEKGRDLQPALLALTQWGDRWYPGPHEGPRIEFVDRETQQPIRELRPLAADGRELAPRDVRARPGAVDPFGGHEDGETP